jgi:hypothetical protein
MLFSILRPIVPYYNTNGKNLVLPVNHNCSFDDARQGLMNFLYPVPYWTHLDTRLSVAEEMLVTAMTCS